MASSPIASWKIDGETMRTVADFILGGLQNHCRWWLQPWNWKRLTPWKKSYDQPRQHIKKQRHYFANKGPSSEGYGFSSSHVWIWKLDYKESWAPKIDAFELWCWRRLLNVPWTARTTNQSILKEISPEYSLEEVILKLKLQYLAIWCEELTHWKRLWCWERLNAGGERNDRGWDDWVASPTQWTWVWASSGQCWRTDKPGVLQSMGFWGVRHYWATEQQQSFGCIAL